MLEQEMVREGIKGDFWRYAKGKIMKNLVELGSIESILDEVTDPQQIALEMKTRQGAISLIREWIADVEGMAELEEFNKMPVEEDDDHIKRYG